MHSILVRTHTYVHTHTCAHTHTQIRTTTRCVVRIYEFYHSIFTIHAQQIYARIIPYLREQNEFQTFKFMQLGSYLHISDPAIRFFFSLMSGQLISFVYVSLITGRVVHEILIMRLLLRIRQGLVFRVKRCYHRL